MLVEVIRLAADAVVAWLSVGVVPTGFRFLPFHPGTTQHQFNGLTLQVSECTLNSSAPRQNHRPPVPS